VPIDRRLTATIIFIFQGWNLGRDNPTITCGIFDDGLD
jgi:hypothetical protein